MMTDSPLATPTLALQCDHPPLARRRRRTLPRVVVRAPLVRRGARRGLLLHMVYVPWLARAGAARSLLRCGLLTGGAMTYLDDCGAPHRDTARSGAP